MQSNVVSTNAISYNLMMDNFIDYAQKPSAYGLYLTCE
jgi:hypothetical protein